MGSKERVLLDDSPEHDEGNDRLHRKEFVDLVENIIRNRTGEGSYVIGLYGEWGSGKTTILEWLLQRLGTLDDQTASSALRSLGSFAHRKWRKLVKWVERHLPKCIQARLEEWRGDFSSRHPHYEKAHPYRADILLDAGESDEERDPIAVYYEPWSYHAGEELAIDFLDAVRLEVIGLSKKWSYLDDVSNDLQTYLKDITGGGIAGPIFGVLRRIVLGRFSRASVRVAKQRVSQELTDKKLVIIIDNLDRLSAEEIREMFSLIKNVLDFKNTIFVVALDHDVVCRALNGIQGQPHMVGESTEDTTGEDYLAKIIQIPLDIPAASQEDIDRFLVEESLTILKDNPLASETVIRGLIGEYHEGFRTIRAAKRFLNTFATKYAGLGASVDFADLYLLTMIEVFETSLYEWISDNRQRFSVPQGFSESEAQQMFANVNKVFEQRFSKDDKRWNTVYRLFWPFGERSYELGLHGRTHRIYEIASTDHYFTGRQPEWAVGDAFIDEVTEVARENPPFTLLRSAWDIGKQDSMLADLKGMDDIDSDVVRQNIAVALLQLFGSVNDERGDLPEGIDARRNAVRLNWAMWAAVKRILGDLPDGGKVDLAMRAFDSFGPDAIAAFSPLMDRELELADPENIVWNESVFVTGVAAMEFREHYSELLQRALLDPIALERSWAPTALRALKNLDEGAYEQLVQELLGDNEAMCRYAHYIVTLGRPDDHLRAEVRAARQPSMNFTVEFFRSMNAAIWNGDFANLSKTNCKDCAALALLLGQQPLIEKIGKYPDLGNTVFESQKLDFEQQEYIPTYKIERYAKDWRLLAGIRNQKREIDGIPTST